MTFDCSRFSFDPTRDFAGVVLQQGRVALDADWNEWLAQLARRLQVGTLDALGQAVVPRETPDAFRIRWSGDTLTIGPGRVYIDGLLIECHGTAPGAWSRALAEPAADGAVDYADQPYQPEPPALPAGPGPHLVYLDCWRRDLTSLHDPSLVEPALGVDTAGRWQMVWQVKVLANWAGGPCVGADLDLGALAADLRPSGGRLSVATGEPPESTDPCRIPPAAGYRGLENQLYRVEVHRGGPLGTATFKWSRDNATVASRVTAFPALDRLIVESLGRDEWLGFHDGDWVEVIDRRRELANLPGELRRLRPDGGVDPATRTLTLASPLPDGAFALGDDGDYLIVRRWDQAGNQYREDGSILADLNTSGADGAIPIQAPGTRLFLEHGILVEFHLEGEGGFRSGDHWTFAARSANTSVTALDRAPPQGIHHHYAPLALIRRPQAVEDLRVPLTPPSGSVHVCSVQASDGAGGAAALRPGQSLAVDRLGEGLAVLIRERLALDSVNDGALHVSAEIPYRLPGAYSGAPQGAVVAYQPVVLPGEVALANQGVLTWTPYGQTVAFLTDLLAGDVARLGNVRFESELEVFDHGGPRSQWGLAPGNLVIQTAPAAGTSPTGARAGALPTTAVHRYRVEEGAVYAGLTADLSGTGVVGMVFDWRDAENWSYFFVENFWGTYSGGGYPQSRLGFVEVRDGAVVDQNPRVERYLATSHVTRISLDIKQSDDRLQFGGRATFSYGSQDVQDTDWQISAKTFAAGSRLGLATAGLSTARFSRLQVNYPGQAPVTLVPAGIAHRLLARLVLKRSLLAVADPAGTPLGGAFAAPVPEPDFETWFWLTPAAPRYGYRYGYGGGIGGLFGGIGVERLLG
ncbi:DUF6519 domain-containing protein [Thiococcus pfennigii]|uniref:DUF6519 domain-containing protein n=1 Tax=Thiococcus pfennigii TaxID=1057 RepID=UPI001905A403|nr:DUF6519 domain-containing protein [Thiococcus pfennigii]MBK1733163.1 hypothetical protein [Thiococcus pfennigii]